MACLAHNAQAVIRRHAPLPLAPWLFVAPAMVLVCLTVLVPALMALMMSFHPLGPRCQ